MSSMQRGGSAGAFKLRYAKKTAVEGGQHAAQEVWLKTRDAISHGNSSEAETLAP